MDMSLDDIINSKPRFRRGDRGGRGSGRGGGARSHVLGNRQATAAAAAGTRVQKVSGPPAVAHVAEKIIVSNLPADVNESQVKELFVQTVGPVRGLILHYNAQGKWNGSATVHFQRRGDATAAYNQYNNRLIDGKRAMKIEVVVDPASVPPAASLVQRVAPTNGTARVEGVPRSSTRGRGRRGRGGGRTSRPQKSVADLDAEMEDYSAASAPVASADA